jgi:hypothetical protein
LYAKTKVEKILDAIQKEDADAIKNFFSKNTINAVGEQEMDAGINYLFSVIQGDIVSVDVSTGGVFESVRYGKRLKRTTINAVVTTDVDAYDLYAADEIFNSFDRGDTGISVMVLQRRTDWEQYGDPSEGYLGVFRTDIIDRAIGEAGVNVSRDSDLDAVIAALENNDAEAISGLFSEMARELVGEEKLGAGVEYSSELLDGDVDAYRDSRNAKKYVDIEDGNIVMTVFMECYLYCNKDTEKEKRYWLYYRDVLIDELHPDQVGIDQVMIEKNDGGSGRWVNPSEAYGIYCAERDDPNEYIVNLYKRSDD